MLVLGRKTSQSILIGSEVKVTLVRTNLTAARLGVDAPSRISIVREELADMDGKNVRTPDCYVCRTCGKAAFTSSDMVAHMKGCPDSMEPMFTGECG